MATRFIKGVSAGFTAPAGLSIITTSFAEGPARNKALSIYTATGATGFSLGLVLSGVLTEIGWRWVFFFPVPLALLTLIAAIRLVPNDGRPPRSAQRFDVRGGRERDRGDAAARVHVGRGPGRGLGVGARWLARRGGAILAAFVAHEQRAPAPLVRLGILRSGGLVRANLGAMSLVGAWFGFQFVLTLYLQQVRGWSALETGLAIFPAGFIVTVLATQIAPMIERFGVTRLIGAGLASTAAGYALFLPIGLDSSYAGAMLPSFLLPAWASRSPTGRSTSRPRAGSLPRSRGSPAAW